MKKTMVETTTIVSQLLALGSRIRNAASEKVRLRPIAKPGAAKYAPRDHRWIESRCVARRMSAARSRTPEIAKTSIPKMAKTEVEEPSTLAAKLLLVITLRS